MKILELTNYSAGGCGVWARVKQESELLLQRGHDALILSSNLEKGSNKIVSAEEAMGKLKVKRYPAKRLGGESFMFWLGREAVQEALKFQPDVIVAHVYRHPHTLKALKIKKILEKQGRQCKVFLVTHAPFIPANSTRSFLASLSVNLYDCFIGQATLNKFDRIIAISRWEIPYLLNLGAKKEKMAYIPNGIPEEFFKLKKLAEEENKILFLGRISPIKDIEALILAVSLMKDEKIALEIVGPAEEAYLSKLKRLVKNLNLEKKIIFSHAIYGLREKIKKIDSCRIFVLPSKREAMPQALIEVMARGKIAVSSDNPGSKDIIQDGKNGYLFKIGDEKDLAKKISRALSANQGKIQKNAKNSVKKFRWAKLILSLEKLCSVK